MFSVSLSPMNVAHLKKSKHHTYDRPPRTLTSGRIDQMFSVSMSLMNVAHLLKSQHHTCPVFGTYIAPPSSVEPHYKEAAENVPIFALHFLSGGFPFG